MGTSGTHLMKISSVCPCRSLVPFTVLLSAPGDWPIGNSSIDSCSGRRLKEGNRMRVGYWSHCFTPYKTPSDWLCPSSEGRCCSSWSPIYITLSFWILEIPPFAQPSRPRDGNIAFVTTPGIWHYVMAPYLCSHFVNSLNLSVRLCFAGFLTLP